MESTARTRPAEPHSGGPLRVARSPRPLLAIVASLLASLVLSNAGASAATVSTHPFVGSLTPPSSATPKGPFWPGGVAINQSTGNVYVTDITNDVVDVFNSSGAFLFKLDGSDAAGGGFNFAESCCVGSLTATIAVDNSGGPTNGRVYVHNNGGLKDEAGKDIHPIDILQPDGTFISAILGFLVGAQSVAVDADGLLAVGTSHDVKVVDPEIAVEQGTNLTAAAVVREYPGVAADATSTSWLAFDLANNLYVTTHASDRLAKYSADGELQWRVGESGGVTGAAVDRQTGHVYGLDDQYGFSNSDGDSRTIAEYDSAGTLLRRFGLSIIPDGGSQYAVGIGIHEATGRLYAADPANDRVAVFAPAANATAPSSTVGVTTDVIGTPSAGSGDISLLATGKGDLTKGSTTVANLVTDTGTFSVGESISGSGIPVGTTIEAVGGGTLTLSSPATANGTQAALVSGSKTVSSLNTTSGSFEVGETVLGSGIPPQATITAVGGGTLTLSQGVTGLGGGATPGIGIALSTDIVATAHGTVNPAGASAAARFQYRKAKTRKWISSPLQQGVGSGSSDVPLEAVLSKLAQNTTYEIRVQAANETNGATTNSPNVTTFTTAGLDQAILTINPASSITSTSAHLSGTVDPNGSTTKWRFEYTTDNSSEENWIQIGKDQSISAGAGVTPVSADLTGLQPNKHYFVRIIATNDGGPKESAEVELTTDAIPPEALPLGAGCLNTTSACLGAMIDSKNSATTYYFEYGTDETYGTSVPVGKDASAGSGFGLVKRTLPITGLEPDTVYHFRVLATNQAGTTTTEDGTFETHPLAAEAEADWPARGFELVSSPDKGNQSAFSYAGAPMTDDRVLWNIAAGAPGSTTGTEIAYLSIRGEHGWQAKPLAPPAAEQPEGGRASYQLYAASPDLTSFVFKLNGGVLANTIPGTILRVDDQGNQVQLGTTFPASFDVGDLEATADSRRAVFENPDESGRLVEFFEEGSTPIEVPACGYDLPLLESGQGSYSWMASLDTVLFVESAGEGPCSAPAGVFRIEGATGKTDLISGPQTVHATFVRTNADGTAAIYVKAGEIYRWELDSGSTCLTCFTGDTDALEDSVLVSSDFERIYFTSPQRLDPGRGFSGLPCAARGSSCNAYLLEDGEVEFVGVTRDPSTGGIALKDGGTAAATPDGRTLLFFSNDPRTTADATGTRTQLYRYDAEAERVECISCVGRDEPMVGSTDDETSSPPSPSRYDISDDGRTVAFSTTAALAPEDVNGTRDIYEWHDGLQRLITDGVSEIPDLGLAGSPAVWGLSSDASNLIFGQRGRLVGNETDGLTSVYNARLGGGTVLPEPPAPCVEDACQGPLETPPAVSNPGSSAFSGPGNEQAAKAKKKAKKKKRKAQRKHQAKKHKRANGERGGRR